ncbi:MAG: GNAT family N-acetyltransferase [Lentimicrobiaceae bacterium]|nr:GNAT family N-acetyltransferase [Lentimicrobiaceae bacterium]
MQQQPIIPPVDRNLIEAELTPDKLIRKTTAGNNHIYIVDYHNAPNVTRELGRLREITFRDAGGGTGLDCDLDEFDTGEHPFQQLLVWNPAERDIIGGYRFIDCNQLTLAKDGSYHTPTLKLFNYSEKFVKEYLPYTIELGRSFVQPNYQPANNIRKGMYSLDNIWDGLGALVHLYPNNRYFFGKITMYPDFDRTSRDLILYFMNKYFHDPDKLVFPMQAVQSDTPVEILESAFPHNEYDKDYKALIQNVRQRGEHIPPLVNAYMNLSSTMRYFGTAVNHSFGAVEETGIIVTINDIYEIKKDRYIKFGTGV